MVPSRVSTCILCVGFAALLLPTSALAQDEPQIPPDNDPKTTKSGLVYSVLRPGKPGPSPKRFDQVRVHYTGWLEDGTVRMNSRAQGVPAKFVRADALKGLSQGLGMMTAGARYKFTIPPKLAFGNRGSEGIPPGATLIFDVELVSFIPAPSFVRPNPRVLKSTPTGLKFQILMSGVGDAPKVGDIVELEYAFWNMKGRLVKYSKFEVDRFKMVVGDLDPAVLKQAVQLMKPGAQFVFQVPAELGLGGKGKAGKRKGKGKGKGKGKAKKAQAPVGAPSICWVKLERVIVPLPLPEFIRPADDQLSETENGLKYMVIEEGEGAHPRLGQKVRMHYAAWLLDGTAFDSSYTRGEPMEKPLRRLMPAWLEGIPLMKPGAVFIFVVPPHLAYGARGYPPKVGPNATLIFRVELLE